LETPRRAAKKEHFSELSFDILDTKYIIKLLIGIDREASWNEYERA